MSCALLNSQTIADIPLSSFLSICPVHLSNHPTFLPCFRCPLSSFAFRCPVALNSQTIRHPNHCHLPFAFVICPVRLKFPKPSGHPFKLSFLLLSICPVRLNSPKPSTSVQAIYLPFADVLCALNSQNHLTSVHTRYLSICFSMSCAPLNLNHPTSVHTSYLPFAFDVPVRLKFPKTIDIRSHKLSSFAFDVLCCKFPNHPDIIVSSFRFRYVLRSNSPNHPTSSVPQASSILLFNIVHLNSQTIRHPFTQVSSFVFDVLCALNSQTIRHPFTRYLPLLICPVHLKFPKPSDIRSPRYLPLLSICPDVCSPNHPTFPNH
ncbi:unnamed protein product [Acanthosepion pharaonis]|uniref:Uncharacterized protein n=1 Tax=Acanthosepion pharaonis TaxID=158019 RepID=A0A812EAX3_ACAPH|nr:unnamed protein product [Sepia pharaonis]